MLYYDNKPVKESLAKKEHRPKEKKGIRQGIKTIIIGNIKNMNKPYLHKLSK